MFRADDKTRMPRPLSSRHHRRGAGVRKYAVTVSTVTTNGRQQRRIYKVTAPSPQVAKKKALEKDVPTQKLRKLERVTDVRVEDEGETTEAESIRLQGEAFKG